MTQPGAGPFVRLRRRWPVGVTPRGSDDAQARALARELGLRMLGTAALLVEAKRAGLLARVRPTLDALLAKGFRLDRKVYDRILKAADEG